MENQGNITQHILNYLIENPKACDTLEGIAKWWVMLQQLNDSVDSVHEALERLTDSGQIVKREGPDGRTLYFARERINKCEI